MGSLLWVRRKTGRFDAIGILYGNPNARSRYLSYLPKVGGGWKECDSFFLHSPAVKVVLIALLRSRE